LNQEVVTEENKEENAKKNIHHIEEKKEV